MQEEIERELARLGGRSACVVLRLNPSSARGYEQLVALRPEQRFAAASLAKVPMLVEMMQQVHAGQLSWDTCYAVAPEQRVAGSGVLAELSSQLRPTLADLAYLMITISDNTASNLLLSLVGMEAVNTTMQHMGLKATRLERRFMDFAARQAGHDNWTCAGDMAQLFMAIATELPERERVLAILLRQNDYTLLPGYWGEDIPFAHKTGALEGTLHDAGILYPSAPASASTPPPIVIAALTDQQTDEPLTRYVLARIGRILYDKAARL